MCVRLCECSVCECILRGPSYHNSWTEGTKEINNNFSFFSLSFYYLSVYYTTTTYTLPFFSPVHTAFFFFQFSNRISGCSGVDYVKRQSHHHIMYTYWPTEYSTLSQLSIQFDLNPLAMMHYTHTSTYSTHISTVFRRSTRTAFRRRETPFGTMS